MSTPNVLFVGGSKGSWQVRGRQIAAALPNARAVAKPTPGDWAWADVVVLVKRAPETWWREAAACGKPVIWDVLDFWLQPRDNDLPEAAHLQRIAQIKREANVSLLIGATKAMAKAIGGVYLPHHSRIGLTPRSPRSRAEVVGYDGSARYLGSWRPALERACGRLGLRFVVNPEHLSTADILVAFRGEDWDGWACREWKSGVKYVNAIASGRPILTQLCAAVGEIGPFAMLVDEQSDLTAALSEAMSLGVRESAYLVGVERAPEFTVDAIAASYAKILRSVVRRAA